MSFLVHPLWKMCIYFLYISLNLNWCCIKQSWLFCTETSNPLRMIKFGHNNNRVWLIIKAIDTEFNFRGKAVHNKCN